MNRSILGALVALALIFGVQSFSFAIPCVSGGVTGSIDCQDAVEGNDFPAPDTVNDEEFFGFTDWEYLAKQNIGGAFEGSTDYDWDVTPTTASQTGEWSFNSSVWGSFEDVMIVVKAGNAFSGYLLDNTTWPVSGDWDTGDKDLSHLTLYARGEGSGPPAPVPEPTTMLLFGTGLLGLVGVVRRKKK